MRILLFLLFTSVLPSSVAAAQGCTTEDFEGFNVPSPGTVDTYSYSIDENTFLSVWSQGPGLVADGCAYLSMGSTIYWSDAGYFGLPSRGLQSAGGGTGMAMLYDQPVQTVSFDMHAYAGYPETVNVRVYDANYNLLAMQNSISVPGTGPVPMQFSIPGIKRIEVQSLTYSGSPIIDNHVFCGTPPPATLTLVGQCGQPGSGVKASGMTPNALVGFAYSPNTGAAVVNAPGCGSLTLGLGAPLTVFGTLFSDPAGEATALPLNGIPAAACGNFHVQALDLTSCTLTNVLGL